MNAQVIDGRLHGGGVEFRIDRDKGHLHPPGGATGAFDLIRNGLLVVFPVDLFNADVGLECHVDPPALVADGASRRDEGSGESHVLFGGGRPRASGQQG
ncbi:hypothetical protein D3C72_1854320 [compost metagenome]